MTKSLSSYLERNARIVVTLASEPYEVYDSRIEDLDPKRVYISIPTNNGRPAPVKKGSSLSVSVLSKNGRVTFDTKVSEIIKNPVPMLVLDKTDSLRFEQLRQFYRIPLRLKARMFHGTLEKMAVYASSPAGVPFMDVTLNDLSGGGFNITTDIDIIDKDNVVIDFGDIIQDIHKIEATAVRVDKVMDKRAVSFTFANIDEPTTDKIVRFIFRKQMEMRNKL